MRLAMGAALVCVVAMSARADTRFASLHIDSIACDVGESLTVGGEGTSSLALAGGIGPVVGGGSTTFSLAFEVSFDSLSVPGDGVVSFLSLEPSYASGALEVTDFSLATDLFSGAAFVSHVDGASTTPGSLASGTPTTLTSFAFSYDAPGAPGFSVIGDNGTLTATLDFSWTGSSAGDVLAIDVLPDSEITYAFYIPSPGSACLIGMGGLHLVRRRRAG